MNKVKDSLLFYILGFIILMSIVACSEKDRLVAENVIHFIGSSCSADLVKTGYCERTVKTNIGVYNVNIKKVNG